jgi:hypothetical protein
MLRMQRTSLAAFADSAHLSRTSRRMIGIPPSPLDIFLEN